jgi:hypothetical protein
VPPTEEAVELEPAPEPSVAGPITELHVLVPGEFNPGKQAADVFLHACRSCTAPLSFELVGRAGTVSLQLACSPHDSATVIRQLASIAPDVAVLPRDDYLATMWEAVSGFPLVVDLGLSEEFMRPLAEASSFSLDPLVQIIGALTDTTPHEIGVVQVLAAPARRPWAEHIKRAVTDSDGEPFFAGGADLVAHAKKKVSASLYACRVRIAAKAGSRVRTRELVRGLASAFDQFANPPGGNSLIPLDHQGLSEGEQEQNLLDRTSNRCGMLLNADELAALIHLPGRETTHTALERLQQRTKAAPDSTRGHELILGENFHRGVRHVVTLSAEQRSRHLYVIGGSGTGKSTLLLNLITQDIEAGRGVAVLDPHGDLVEAVAARIPESRVEDVVLIDPADADYPVGINVLAVHSELERTLLASDLVAAFRRQSTSWGDQMNAVFANALLAFLLSREGGTLAEVRRFLVEKEYRAAFLHTVEDEEVRYYWQKEFPLLRGNAQAPILTRLDAFLRPKLVRNIVANPGGSLDFRAALDGNQILLAKLSQGAIGEENAHLLGSVILSKLQQIALSRQDVGASSRPPFYVYLDEFQHFATPTTATLLSGVRKYGLSLTLAHQNLSQVSDELVDSVLANAGTRICFRLGDSDARKLASGFSFFDASDLQNLDTGEAICRVGRADNDFNLSTYAPSQVGPQQRGSVEAVIEASRRQWTTALPAPALPASPTSIPLVLPLPAPEIGQAPEPVHVDAAAAPLPVLPVVPTPPASRPRAVPVTPGRGGQQHKYLQALIKRLGEDRGCRATIEYALPAGEGSVDVLLEREGLRVAFEISVTTPTAHELGNARKCLDAGFDLVVMVGVDARACARIQKALQAEAFRSEEARLVCVAAAQLPEVVDQLTGSAQPETVAGYDVRVRTRQPSGSGSDTAQQKLREIITRSLRRS